jgi:hypothetical protein
MQDLTFLVAIYATPYASIQILRRGDRVCSLYAMNTENQKLFTKRLDGYLKQQYTQK